MSYWLNKLLLPSVALAAVIALDITAHASIILPAAEFELELPAMGEARSDDSPSTDNGEAMPMSQEDTPAQNDLTESDAPGPASGGNGSGASGGGVSNSNSPNVLLDRTMITPEDNLLGWFLGEFSLSVPDPPGSDLLRPPQG